MFQKALLQKHGIRNCVVRLERLIDSKIPASQKKKLLPAKKKLRSEVNWLPNSSSVLVNSSNALSALAVYQEKNNIVLPVARKNARRQRAKSMFANRANDDGYWNEMNGLVHSKDDISELQSRLNSPNFGLKSTFDRSLEPKPQQPLSDFQKMFVEFKKRIVSKSIKK